MATSLYVHIPFCQKICSYCDFSKVLFNQKWAFSYIEALIKEIDAYNIKPHSQRTIYVGGGTPTALPDELFESLLVYLRRFLRKGGEFTVEANPESLTPLKIAIMKDSGVNRVSLGMQSANQAQLKLMERTHSYEDVRRCVDNLKTIGITNINVDLIYALPGEDISILKDDIKALIDLDVPHISTYSLILEDSTKFKNLGYKEADDSLIADQYEEIINSLRRVGYERYEVSNFAKPGFESRHNTVYWKNKEYYGVGMGASGYLNGIRYKNTGSITKYINGETISQKEEVKEEDKLCFFLMTNLRLKEGFTLSSFQKYIGKSFEEVLGNRAEPLIKTGLLEKKSGRVHATDKGMLLLDKVTVDLMD